MMSGILGNALSGLRTTQTLLDTISRNVANAQTEGYTRKVQHAVTNGVTGGAAATAVLRAADESVLADLRRSTGAAAYSAVLAEGLSALDRLSGDPGQGMSLSARLAALGSAFQQASADSTQPAAMREVVRAAEDLTRTLNTMSHGARRLADEARDAIGGEVAVANALLEQIAGLNARIAKADALSGDATDLRDQRDRLTRQLSGLMDVRGFEDGRGVLHVYSADNKLLATERARALEADGSGGLSVNGETVRNIGGSLGAHQQIAEVVVPRLLAQLDAVAGRLTEEFASAAGPGLGVMLFTDGGGAYDPAGVPGEAGFAGRIAVNPDFVADPDLVRNGPPGTNDFLAAARDVFLDTTLTFGAPGLPGPASLEAAAVEISARIAGDAVAARSMTAEHMATRDYLMRTAAESGGVNLDDELARMVVLQNAYAASARMLQAYQSMVDELLSLTR